MTKKILSIALTLAVILSMMIFPAGAADKLSPEENNKQISTRAKELEKKFGIDITYPTKDNGYAQITMNNLETLERAFDTATPHLVKQISSYYEKRNGSKININYVFSKEGFGYNGGVLMAAFERSTSMIYVFLPANSGTAIISGENPIAIVHELGHAFHLMCVDKYGMDKMRAEWSKFNAGISYNPYGGFNNPDKKVFITGYASTSFEEDVAEIFAHSFVRIYAGTGFKNHIYSNGKLTNLGQKVAYVERLINTYISQPQSVIANYRRVYSTPTSMTFEGVKFSGEYLQYIGYPQPPNILNTILRELDIAPKKSTWVRKLGAWRVTDQYGDMFFIFPGGSWSSASVGLIEE